MTISLFLKKCMIYKFSSANMYALYNNFGNRKDSFLKWDVFLFFSSKVFNLIGCGPARACWKFGATLEVNLTLASWSFFTSSPWHIQGTHTVPSTLVFLYCLYIVSPLIPFSLVVGHFFHFVSFLILFFPILIYQINCLLSLCFKPNSVAIFTLLSHLIHFL